MRWRASPCSPTRRRAVRTGAGRNAGPGVDGTDFAKAGASSHRRGRDHKITRGRQGHLGTRRARPRLSHERLRQEALDKARSLQVGKRGAQRQARRHESARLRRGRHPIRQAPPVLLAAIVRRRQGQIQSGIGTSAPAGIACLASPPTSRTPWEQFEVVWGNTSKNLRGPVVRRQQP